MTVGLLAAASPAFAAPAPPAPGRVPAPASPAAFKPGPSDAPDPEKSRSQQPAPAATKGDPVTPAVAPTAEGPRRNSAERAAADQARGSGERVEVTDRRTESTTTYANPDGSFTLETFPAPVRVKRDGRWQDVDLRLTDRNGALEPAAAPAQVRLSRGKDNRLAELASGERSLGLDWPTELPAPVVEGRTATYTIDDTTKLVVAVNRAGFEQHVVLSGPPSAPPSYTFPLRLKGLRLSKGPGGELLLHDAAGRLVSQSQAPRLWDARRDPRTDEPVKSAPLDVQIVDEPGRQELRISAPADFLDQDTVYPVTLDPNPSLAILGDTWIQNTIANTSQYGSTELRSGTFDGGATVARSLLKFDTSGLSGTINSATFSLWNWYSYSCNLRRTNIVALSGGFSSNTVWGNQPSAIPTVYGFSDSAKGYTGCAAGRITFDLRTLVDRWMTGAITNNGMQVKASSETDSFGWRKYNSGNNAAEIPKLDVNYTPPATVPDPPQNVQASAGDSYATATWDPPASDGGSAVTGYRVTLYNTGTGLVTQADVGVSNSYTVTNLANGQGYYYRIQARNSVGLGAYAQSPTVVPATWPGKPTGVTASRGGSQTANVSWTAPTSDGGAAIDFYWVSRYRADGTYEGYNTTTGTSISFGGLTNGADYYFIVYAHNRAGYSDPSDRSADLRVAGPPQPPTNVRVTGTADKQATVTWDAVTGSATGGMDVDYYYVYAWDAETRQTAAGDFAYGTTLTLGGLQNGKRYYFTAYAHTPHDSYGFSGPSADSATVLVDVNRAGTPVITSPDHAENTWSANRTATFAWTTATGDYPIAGYSVVFDQTRDTQAPTTQTTATPQHTQTGIADGTNYLHVRAVDTNGNWGSTTGHYRVLVDGTAPAAPTITVAAPHDAAGWKADNTPEFSWTVSDTAPIDGYSWVVDREPGTMPDTVSEGTASNTTPTLTDGTWYLHVRARNAAGLWGATSTRQVQIDTTRPAEATATSPTHNTTDAVRTRDATFDWTPAPGSDATSGIAGYSWSVTPNPGDLPDATVDTTLTKISTTLADGTYYFHLAAVDRAGNVSLTTTYGPIRVDQNAPPVGDTDRDRFVALWKPRVTSDTYGKDYLAQDGYPPEILAEGFHGLLPEQEKYLVDALYASLRADTPPGEDDPQTEEQLVGILLRFVFDKSTLKDIPNLSDLPATAANLQDVAGLSSPILDAATAATTLDLAPADLALPELPDAAVAPLDTGFPELPVDVPTEVASSLSPETITTLGDVTGVVGDTLGDLTQQASSIAAEAAFPIDTGPIHGVTSRLPVDVDYTVCWDSVWNGQARNGCADSQVVAVPVNFDVTGDGTDDLTATFGPAAGTDPAAGLSFQYDLRRHTLPLPADTDGKPIRAHVWIVYDLPTADTQLRVGFDGLRRGAALSEQTTATYTLADILRLPQRDLISTFQLTHTGPAASWALTVGAQRLNEADPTQVSVAFTPPADYSGDLDVIDDDSADESVQDRQLRLKVTGSATSRIETVLNAVNTSTSSTLLGRVLLQDLAAGTSEARYRKQQRSAGSDPVKTEEVHVTAPGPFARVAAAAEFSRSGERAAFLADLRDVPARADYVMTEKDGRSSQQFTASGRITRALASYRRDVGGVLRTAVTGAVSDVASSTDVRYGPSEQAGDDRMLLTYTASDRVTAVDAAGYFATGQVIAAAKLRGLPRMLSASGGVASRMVSVDASEPIDSAVFGLSRGGGTVHRPSGDHLTYVAKGSTLGISARISGLQSASAAWGDTYQVATRFSPGGQRLLLLGAVDTSLGFADVSNVPAGFQGNVEPDQTHARFTTTDRVSRLRFYASRGDGGPTVEASLSNLPTDVDVKGVLNIDQKTLAYRADAELGSIDRLVLTTDGVVGDRSGVTIIGTLQRLPKTVDVAVNRATRTLHASTGGGSIGLIDLVASVTGGTVLRSTSDHATFNGTTEKFGASLRLAGFQSLDVSVPSSEQPAKAALRLVPGGQSFVAAANLDQDRYRLDVTNLPSALDVTVDGNEHIRYEASEVIRRVQAYRASLTTGPTIVGFVENVPTLADLTVSNTGQQTKVSYTGQGSVSRAGGYYSSRPVTTAASSADDFIAADVQGLFESAEVTYDGAAKRVAYRASDPVAEVRAAGRGLVLGDFAAGVAVRDVPAQLDVNFGNDRYLFDPQGGRIGQITAVGSNTGTLVRLPGRHLYGRVDLGDDRYQISADLTGVGRLEYAKAGDALKIAGSVDLAGQPMVLDFDLDDLIEPASDDAHEFGVTVRGTLSRFPSALAIRATDEGIQYAADDSIDARLDAAVGWRRALATAPAPRPRYGLSVTDGACDASNGCATRNAAGEQRLLCNSDRNQCYGVRARLDFDGLPTNIGVNIKTPEDQPIAVIGGLKPRRDLLQVRADVRHLLGEPLMVELQQEGLVPDTALRFGPVSTGRRDGQTGLPISVKTNHDAPMGRLQAAVSAPGRSIATSQGTFTRPFGYVSVSNVPAQLDVRAGFGASSKIDLNVSQAVNEVVAVVRAVKDDTTPVAAAAVLGDVPAVVGGNGVDVTIKPPPAAGKDKGFSVPDVDVAAPAAGMDVGAVVDAGFVEFDLGDSASVRLAEISFGIDNAAPGLTSRFDANSKRIELASTGGRTGRMFVRQFGFDLDLDVPITYDKTIAKISRARIQGSATGALQADGVGILIEDSANITITPARNYLALGVEGDFGRLSAGIVNLRGGVDVSVNLRLERWPFWSWIPPYIDQSASARITQFFGHALAADKFGRLACASAQVGDQGVKAEILTRPGYQGLPLYRNGLVVEGALGKQVVGYVDPSGGGGALSAIAVAITALAGDPFGTGEHRINAAAGRDGTC